MAGEVKFSLIVDPCGVPRNIVFAKALGNDLDRLALAFLESERFEPGSFDGHTVAVGGIADMFLKACTEKSTDSNGKQTHILSLQAEPRWSFQPTPSAAYQATLAPIVPDQRLTEYEARTVPEITPPKPLVNPPAEFPAGAREARIEGEVGLSLIVDANGLPENVRVIKSLEPSLDQSAVDSARKSRFTPAIRDGAPTPVVISIQVVFHLH